MLCPRIGHGAIRTGEEKDEKQYDAENFESRMRDAAGRALRIGPGA